MGWGRMMLLGNVGQQLDIQELGNSIGAMQNALRQSENELRRNANTDFEQSRSIQSLKRENDELKLYLATLVKLLVAKGVVRQDEIDAAVSAIDKP